MAGKKGRKRSGKKKDAKSRADGKKSFQNRGMIIGMLTAATVILVAVFFLLHARRPLNPYRTDLPEKRTAQLGSLLFDVPGEWQIGGTFSFYKDFYLDSSDRMNYSRVCYTVLSPQDGRTLTEWAEEFWVSTEKNWSLTGTKVNSEEIRLLETEAVRISFKGSVPARNVKGEILLIRDPADESVLCLTCERVGGAKSPEKDFDKIVDTLRIADGTETPTEDRWYGLNADTMTDYAFDFAMIEYNEGNAAGVQNSRHVYLYDRADQIIFYFTQAKEEPYTVEASWTPENLLIYRYVGDPQTGALAFLPALGYPDLMPTQRNWFIKENVHWAKGTELYDTHEEGNAGELVEQFLNEFGAFA